MPLSREELIQKIHGIAQILGQEYLSIKQFISHTGISSNQIYRYYARWNDAVREAGLQPLDTRGHPNVHRGYSREKLVEKAKELARNLSQDYLSKKEFKQHTSISERPVYRLFKDWNSFLRAAGLKPHPNHKQKISDESLFEDYLRVYGLIGHLPSYHELAKYAHYSIGVFERRFGTFSKFRQQAVFFGIDHGLLSPDVESSVPDPDSSRYICNTSVYGKLSDRPVLGETIDFRGLQHAPVNEMGVVFLFGMLAEELGFTVESVQAGFPDCEAKRRLKKDQWQRVRIEFEFRSSNFLLHQHDRAKCDLIICWEHDWRDCPLEVICLRDIVHKNKS